MKIEETGEVEEMREMEEMEEVEEIEVRHEPENDRFVADLDDRVATLDYSRVDERTLDYERTFVPGELREHGIGSHLVERALDYARDHGLRVVASCPFVEEFIEDRPEYQDLLAEPTLV